MNYSLQTNAWLVPVRTKRMGGGQPMLVMYASVYQDPIEAQIAVKNYIEALEGDDLDDIKKKQYPLSDSSINALGLKAGDVKMV